MRGPGSLTRLACLLLALVFIGAQLHLCVDFAATGSGSHVCQVCATAGHVIVSQAGIAEFSLIISRLEAASQQANFSSQSFQFTAPRAPPSI